MSDAKELVVYTRSSFCPYQRKADRVFDKYNVAHRVILINTDDEAERRVINWTGFKSVPTIIVTRPGEDFPYEEPEPLPRGNSPRGIDRGSMITEANEDQLEKWLRKHGFINGE